MVPDDNDISDYSIEPLNKLICTKVQDEFREMSMTSLVTEFANVASEFIELSARKRELEPEYSKILMSFINQLCAVFKCRTIPMLADVNKYTTLQWGNVYWRFMHYSSILVGYAYEHKMICSFLDFATVVYQIHLILPCSMCRGHFLAIRDSQNVKDAIKLIAFGMPVLGVHRFHNIITDNVDTVMTKMSAHQERRPPFLMSDFARTYKCIAFADETTKSSTTYVKTFFDWQPITHTLIATILMTYTRQSYLRASCFVKTVYNATIGMENNRYVGEKQTMNNNNTTATKTTPYSRSTTLTQTPKPAPFFIQSPAVRVFMTHESDQVFVNLTPKQCKYLLMKALLLNFENTEYTAEMIRNNVELNSAIIEMYRRHPDTILDLANRNLINGIEDEKVKKRIVGTVTGLRQTMQ